MKDAGRRQQATGADAISPLSRREKEVVACFYKSGAISRLHQGFVYLNAQELRGGKVSVVL